MRNSPLCDTNDKELNKLVNEIISLRNSDDKADITNITTQIDQLVYQLYELTEEEIKIIEESYS